MSNAVRFTSPANYAPPRDRRVQVRGAACGDCGAAVDQKCMTRAGKAMSNTHPSRRRMAIRAGL